MADDSSTPSSSPFVLNASETNGTQLNLVPSTSNSSNSTLSSNEMLVTLSLPMFVPTSASTELYCATFDPEPAAPASLTVQKCTGGQADEHSSQLFAYNSDTGVVRPMWSQGQGDGTDMENKECSEDVDPSTPRGASLASVTDMDDSDIASMNNSSDPAAESTQTAPATNSSAGETASAQNVALVFVAAEPVVQDTPMVTSTTAGSVQATATGVESKTTAFSTSTGSSATTSSSVSTISVHAAAAISTPAPSLPSSSTPSIPRPTPTVLGVEVVAKLESNSTSVSASPTPSMTPMNNRPYKWMFKLDSPQN
jgi:hypothetical protein